jgi:hypothetical protein
MCKKGARINFSMLSAFRQEEQKTNFPIDIRPKRKIYVSWEWVRVIFMRNAQRENIFSLSHSEKRNIYDKYIFYSRIFTFSFSSPLLFVAWRHGKQVVWLVLKNHTAEKSPSKHTRAESELLKQARLIRYNL